MRTINIESTPSQDFTLNIGDYRYDIRLFLDDDEVMAYDLSIDEAAVIQGQRIISGELMLPYQYQEADGNFYLSVPADEDPDYEQFGDSQKLYYLTAGETAEVRASGY